MQSRKGFRTPQNVQAADPHLQTFQSARALHEQGNLSEAKKLYEEILKKTPDHFDALQLSGVIAFQSRNFDESEAFYAKAVRINSNFAPLHSNRGNTLKELKRFDEALASYDKAISVKSDYADAFINRGIMLQELKRFDEALASYDKAISVKSDYADAFIKRGITLQELKRFDEALASYDKAISIKSDYAEAIYNRGNTLDELKRFDEALASYDKAISIKSDYAEAFNNRGITLKELSRFDEALASYDKAISIKSEYADAFKNKGLVRLLLGELTEGLTLYEWRKLQKEPSGARSYSKPLWLADKDLTNKTILVHYEQGLGDTIQFCRYVSMVSNMGAKVLFAPQKPLRGIIASLGDDFEVVDAEDNTLQFDYHCPLLSLPLAFKTELATIPNKTPYLTADLDLISKWKQRLGGDGFKIGICWQGSTAKVDAGRSFPLEQFQTLSDIAGVRLISLHKGIGEAQLLDLPKGMAVETLGGNFDSGPDAFMDTAAVMKCCDLVITSDTAVAHLAGALGVKTWVALKFVPDWRWMLDRDDSLWYPTMRLFRQQSYGDWDGVFVEIRKALEPFLSSKKNPQFKIDPPQSKVTEVGSLSNHKQIFNMIYERNIWGNGSGSGSTPANTEGYRTFLLNFIRTNKIKSVVDLGCGDWQFSKLIDWSGINYIGIDVSDVVLKNTKLFGSDKISFLEMDALTGELPGADLLIMKDVIQHWCNGDILFLISRLPRYKRALITNGFHPAGLSRTNADIATGGWRPVDLKLPPFDLKGDYVHWYNGGEPKWVFLWQCES